jgi:ribosome-binding protein aMBF1 (putative translation factor)
MRRAVLGCYPVRDRSGRRKKVEVEAPEEAQAAFVSSFGESIRKGRLAHGWTQAQLAEAAQLSSNYVARLERGELGPSLFVAHRIAEALGVELGELLEPHPVAPPVARLRRAR